MSLKQTTDCLDYQQTPLSTVTPTALIVPKGATFALIIIEAQPARYLDSKVSTLSTTVGMPLAASQILMYDGDLNSVRFIAQTAGAILNALFYD